MFVIYNKETNRLVRKNCHDVTFNTLRGAKAAATKLNNKYGFVSHIAMSYEQYEFYYNPMVETTNILSGQKCMIRKSEKGGCCDPGTERYHAM